jgi:hypothetical protein
MKYVLLMGRGIEGTGNTKYAVELQKYLESTGNECVTIANADKKWGREKSHPNKIELRSFELEEEYITDICLNSDVIIILSTPAKNYEYFSKLAFHDILLTCSNNHKNVVYIQVDHKIQSINRNYYVDDEFIDFFDYITKIIAHSRNGDFTKFCNKNYIDTSKFIYGDDIGFCGINGLDWEAYAGYWKHFEEKEYKTIKFIGRSAVWKGPWLLRDIHYNYLKDYGFTTTIEGIEGSIQTVPELYKETKPSRIPRDDVIIRLKTEDKKSLNLNTMSFKKYEPAYILPPYDNSFAMDRMSRQDFGIELLMLDDDVLQNIMEYAMMEIVAVGTIPVFRKRWGEMFKVNGKPIIEHECGTIFMDEKNPQEAINEMLLLVEDENAYNTMRNQAFNFYSKHFSSERNFKILINCINGGNYDQV